MLVGLLIGLAVLDCGIVAAMFFLNKKQAVQSDLLNEMMDERSILNEMRVAIKEEADHALARIQKVSDDVKVIATEIEEENSVDTNSIQVQLPGNPCRN